MPHEETFRYPLKTRVLVVVVWAAICCMPVVALGWLLPKVLNDPNPMMRGGIAFIGCCSTWMALQFPFTWINEMWARYVLSETSIRMVGFLRSVELNMSDVCAHRSEKGSLVVISRDGSKAIGVLSWLEGRERLEELLLTRLPEATSELVTRNSLRALRFPMFVLVLMGPAGAIYIRVVYGGVPLPFLAGSSVTFAVKVLGMAAVLILLLQLQFWRLARKHAKSHNTEQRSRDQGSE